MKKTPKEEHYAKRMKREYSELFADLYAIIDGDEKLADIYRKRRQFHRDLEYTILFGNKSTLFGNKSTGGEC